MLLLLLQYRSEVSMNNTPYAPPSNVSAIIRKWRDSRPDYVTDEWLTKIGIKESLFLVNRKALQFLGLVDESSATTDTAKRLSLAPSDQYAAVLEEILRAAYGPIFAIVEPRTSSRVKIDDAFRGEKPESQRSRMVATFLGLCTEAGMPLKEPPQGGRAASSAPTRQQAIKTPRAGANNNGLGSAPISPLPPSSRQHIENGSYLFHPSIDAFLRSARTIAEGDRWTREAREGLIRAFTDQLDLFLPVTTTPRPTPRRRAEQAGDDDGAADS